MSLAKNLGFGPCNNAREGLLFSVAGLERGGLRYILFRRQLPFKNIIMTIQSFKNVNGF